MLDELNDRLNDINTEIEVGDLIAIKGPAQESNLSILGELNHRLHDIDMVIEVGILIAIKGPPQELRPIIGMEETRPTYDAIRHN
ncbi:hypothetical protein AVEN_257261-1 [Araneus ventricosus]|uniref:Uncharacterized protein n=1 Tax=Araneus ventricosus TaxID=182803 RepID=A0A4Y2HBK1_ARAVE|nr:hypothetical protein AVEN_257261-1 [Araneus ventricosus]